MKRSIILMLLSLLVACADNPRDEAQEDAFPSNRERMLEHSSTSLQRRGPAQVVCDPHLPDLPDHLQPLMARYTEEEACRVWAQLNERAFEGEPLLTNAVPEAVPGSSADDCTTGVEQFETESEAVVPRAVSQSPAPTLMPETARDEPESVEDVLGTRGRRLPTELNAALLVDPPGLSAVSTERYPGTVGAAQRAIAAREDAVLHGLQEAFVRAGCADDGLTDVPECVNHPYPQYLRQALGTPAPAAP